jgi:hypothetical protein
MSPSDRNEVLSLVRGEMRAAFEAISPYPRRTACAKGCHCVLCVRDRMLATVSAPASLCAHGIKITRPNSCETCWLEQEPQPAATGLEMPRVMPATGMCCPSDVRSLLDRALALLAEKPPPLDITEQIAAAESRGAAQQKQRDVAFLRERAASLYRSTAKYSGIEGAAVGNAADALEADGAGER